MFVLSKLFIRSGKNTLTLYEIYKIAADILGLKHSQFCFNERRSISANAVSIAAFSDATFGCLTFMMNFSYHPE